MVCKTVGKPIKSTVAVNGLIRLRVIFVRGERLDLRNIKNNAINIQIVITPLPTTTARMVIGYWTSTNEHR